MFGINDEEKVSPLICENCKHYVPYCPRNSAEGLCEEFKQWTNKNWTCGAAERKRDEIPDS